MDEEEIGEGERVKRRRMEGWRGRGRVPERS